MASSVGPGAVGVGVDGPGQRAVVLEGVEGGVGHRVDRVGTDQRVDVEGVGVGRVLGRGRRPQRPLHPGARGGQRLPAGPAERARGRARRRAGPGRPRPCPAAPSASGVPMASSRRSTSVSTRLTKNDATLRHRRQVAAVEASRPRDVGLDDLAVAVEAEDQRDVDAAALADHLRMAGDALGRAGIFTKRFGSSMRCVQVAGRGDGAVGVAGEVGRDLDRHEAVDAVAGVVDRPQDAQRVLDVVDRPASQ